jgi:surface protein
MKKLVFLSLLVFIAITANAQRPFITFWKTDNNGKTGSKKVLLPITCKKYIVEWYQDGNPDNKGREEVTEKDAVLKFPKAGVYVLSITVPNDEPFIFRTEYDYDPEKLIAITQWGDINWAAIKHAFYNCKNLDITARDIPDLTRVTSISDIFKDCQKLVFNESIANWDVSNVTDMSFSFTGCYKFNQPIGGWDVSKVTDMTMMFSAAKSFCQDLTGWDLGSGKKTKEMFSMATAYEDNCSLKYGSSTKIPKVGKYVKVTQTHLTGKDLRKAIALTKQNKNTDAISIFDRLITQNPRLLYVYAHRALAHKQNGNIDLALADYLKDNELNPKNSSYGLAQVYSLKNDAANAIKYLKECQGDITTYVSIAKIADNSDFDNVKGNAEFKTLTDKSKCTAIQQAANNFYEAIDLADYPKAVIAGGNMIKADPKVSTGYICRGYALMFAGKENEAETDFVKAIELGDKETFYANFMIGQNYNRKNEYSKAIEYYEKAYTLNPAFLATHDVTNAYFRASQKNKAIDITKELSENDPNSLLDMYMLAFYLNENGNFQMARDIAGKALDLANKQPNAEIKSYEVFELYGDIDAASKNNGGAATAYGTALRKANEAGAKNEITARIIFKAGVARLNYYGKMAEKFGSNSQEALEEKKKGCALLSEAKSKGYDRDDINNMINTFCQ